MPTKKQDQKDVRDREDIGRILACLLEDSQRDTKAVFSKHITTTRRPLRIRSDEPRSEVNAKNRHVIDLPPFTVEKDFRIFPGGSAIVLEVGNPLIGSLHYALKVERPSVSAALTVEQIDERQRHAEFLKHGPLSHENIARVIAPGQLTLTVDNRGRQSPHDAFLMEWIEGAVPFNAYLRGKTAGGTVVTRTVSEIVKLIVQGFDAIAYLHARSLIHWDLKSDNLLVGETGVVKLMDVGNARRLGGFRPGDIALSTLGNLPPGLVEIYERAHPRARRATALDDSRRAEIPLTDGRWDTPWLDLWMFARELNELFSPVSGSSADRDRFLARTFPDGDRGARFALKFIRLTLERLVYPKDPIADRYYDSAADVASDLRKLEPEFGGAQSVAELWAVPQQVLRTPVSRNVPYPPRLAAIINSSPVRRLGRHLQLGSILHVYPGATHLRFEHAVGVIGTACQYVRALFSDQTNAFWRASIEDRDIKALLVAAAAHDMGHIAFGHYLEEMSGLFRNRTHEAYAQSVLNSDRSKLAAFNDGTREQIEDDRAVFVDIVREYWDVGKTDNEVAAFLDHVADILSPSDEAEEGGASEPLLVKTSSDRLKVHILNSILDSAIDADKLDYLLRDAHHCGVEYANGIDIDRFFQALTAFPDLRSVPSFTSRDGERPPVPRRHASIGVTAKGILSLESILIARYQMFRSVYWHHTARGETAMLQFLVSEYVGGWPGLTGDVLERLEELITKFRDRSDERALRWLRGTLPAADAEPIDCQYGTYRARLFRDMCNCLLGNRRYLYHRIFELRYEQGKDLPDGAEPESDGAKPWQATAEKLYDTLEGLSRELNSREGTTPEVYIHELRRFRKKFSDDLERELDPKISFDVGDILVDIPPAGKDQVENVFVVRGGKIRPIQQMSPIADGVRNAFRVWARHVRVFISRTALKRCADAGITASQLEAACLRSLNAQNREMSLFPEKPRVSSRKSRTKRV
jgi:HD superfamily phosphohydrolase